MTIQVGRAAVGAGQRPYIMAEIGSNWHTIEDCFKSIELAQKCGASAVCFQAFTFQSLYGLGKGHMPSTYNRDYELPLEWLPQLKNKADACSIEFMCTGYDADTIRTIDAYVNAHKIPSSDINHVDALEMAARLRKPVFLNCGASSEAQIGMALTILQNINVVLMYCVASYPAKAVNLFAIDLLQKISPLVGFADHTIDPVYTPLAAIKNHGAIALEKHLICIKKDTPDAYHSLDEREFGMMCDYINEKKKTAISPVDSERDMLLKNRRRLMATKEIKEGERLIYGDNYGIYKTLQADASGFSPYMARELNGVQVRLRLDAGQPITALHVQL